MPREGGAAAAYPHSSPPLEYWIIRLRG